MNRKKRQKIEERLEMIETRLINAREYLARSINVRGTAFLHFGDWRGKSGHPAWMRNFMVPTTLKHRAKLERTLDNIEKKTKDKKLTMRKRRGAAKYNTPIAHDWL